MSSALAAGLVLVGLVLVGASVMVWALLAATGAAEREWERLVSGDKEEP